MDREIKALADKAVVAGTKVEITGGIVTGPMEKTPQVQKMVDVYSRTSGMNLVVMLLNGSPVD